VSTTSAALVALSLAHQGEAPIPACQTFQNETIAMAQQDVLQAAAWLGLRFFQIVVSPGDGSNCTLSPSCSTYAIVANTRQGPFFAAAAAGARVVKDHLDPDLTPCINKKGEARLEHLPPERRGWSVE